MVVAAAASSSAVVRRRRGTRQATGWRASLLAAGRRASPLAARVIVGGCVLPQSCIHQKAVAPSRPQSKRALGEPGVGWGAGRLMPAGLPKTAVIRRSAKTSAARIPSSHRTTCRSQQAAAAKGAIYQSFNRRAPVEWAYSGTSLCHPPRGGWPSSSSSTLCSTRCIKVPG